MHLSYSVFHSWEFFEGAGAIDSQATRDVGQKNFAILKSLLYLCTAFERRIELWCNGNTSDFGSEILGSSPDSSTI